MRWGSPRFRPHKGCVRSRRRSRGRASAADLLRPLPCAQLRRPLSRASQLHVAARATPHQQQRPRRDPRAGKQRAPHADLCRAPPGDAPCPTADAAERRAVPLLAPAHRPPHRHPRVQLDGVAPPPHRGRGHRTQAPPRLLLRTPSEPGLATAPSGAARIAQAGCAAVAPFARAAEPARVVPRLNRPAVAAWRPSARQARATTATDEQWLTVGACPPTCLCSSLHRYIYPDTPWARAEEEATRVCEHYGQACLSPHRALIGTPPPRRARSDKMTATRVQCERPRATDGQVHCAAPSSTSPSHQWWAQTASIQRTARAAPSTSTPYSATGLTKWSRAGAAAAAPPRRAMCVCGCHRRFTLRTVKQLPPHGATASCAPQTTATPRDRAPSTALYTPSRGRRHGAPRCAEMRRDAPGCAGMRRGVPQVRADVAKRGRDQRCVGAGQRVEAIAAETWPARLPSARRAECLRCRAGGGGVERVLHERRRSKVPRRLARRAGDQRAIKIPGATTAPVVLLPARALDRSAQEVTRYTEIGPRSARDRPAARARNTPALLAHSRKAC